MLRAGRTVISLHQAEINNPETGDKGLTGQTVLVEAVGLYQEAVGVDPMSLDPTSRQARLLRAQMDAIAEAVDSNLDTLNKKVWGSKASSRRRSAVLVNEGFNKRANSEAEVKVTAPPDLIRNRKATPTLGKPTLSVPNCCPRPGPKGNRIPR